MSSVLFLAHRSRARVNARVLARRKRDERRKMAGREGEEAGRGTSKRAKRWRYKGGRVREGRGAKERGKQIARTFCTRVSTCSVEGAKRKGECMRLHRRNALGRTEQDGPRENKDIGRREQDGWTNARKARANLFALFGGRDCRLVSIRRCHSDINARISRGIIPG